MSSLQEFKPVPGFGTYPSRRDTVIAEVLAQLLTRDCITSLNAVWTANTTRLPQHILRLRTQYGWRIDTDDRPVRTADGRSTTVGEYRIDPKVRELALAATGAKYVGEVLAARAALRASAGARG